MAFLYLTEQGAYLRMSSDHLLIKKDNKTIYQTPCADIDHIMVFGNIQVTTPAMQKLAQHGISLAFFSRRGRLLFQLTPVASKNGLLRREQHRCCEDPFIALEVCRQIVIAKLKSAADVIRDHRRNNPDLACDTELGLIAKMQRKAERTDRLASLRGYEGTATAAYYKVFSKMVKPPWQFAGRNRRPPRDPVNAVLSFGYVVVGNEIASLLDGIGFDPYLGFYHELHYGRQSLALDMVEEFRHSLVDRLVLHLFNQNVFKPDDFDQTTHEGVYLDREGQQKFFHAYERYLGTFEDEDTTASVGHFRAHFKAQAHKMAHAIQNQTAYQPFQLRSEKNAGDSSETIVI